MSKKSRRFNIGNLILDVSIYSFLVIFAIMCVYPLWQIIVASISDPGIVMKKNGMIMFPQGIQFDAYKIVFSNNNISRGFANTIFYIFFGTLMQYFVTVLAAFTMAKKKVMLKKGIMIFFMIPMFFSGGLIPYFLLINNLGLMDSRWVLVIPYGCSIWNIIIMRTRFNGIPDSLSEAAYIDGASDFRVLFSVMLPVSVAVSAVLILFSVVGYWNMWFEPMIYLSSRSKYPLQSILREILIDNNEQTLMTGGAEITSRISHNNQSSFSNLVKYANIVIGTVPILCIYPFLQKYFVKGIMIGSLKG